MFSHALLWEKTRSESHFSDQRAAVATRRPRVPAAPSGWPVGGADAQLGSSGCTVSAGPAAPLQVDSESAATGLRKEDRLQGRRWAGGCREGRGTDKERENTEGKKPRGRDGLRRREGGREKWRGRCQLMVIQRALSEGGRECA
jgi:hypothetical protein